MIEPSQVNPRECLWQAIDTEVKSLEGSIQALWRRRNALAPVLSLPTEIIKTIFSLLHVPGTPPPSTLDGKPDHLSWLCVAHVCHQWREIALNQPLFWSHVDFNAISSAGAAEIFTRAKMVPLHLEAKISFVHWDNAWFSAFQKELKDHVSHICHLDISAEHLQLNETLNRLTSPAPTLEYLSLLCQDIVIDMQKSLPDTPFSNSTPRLFFLKLTHCAIGWESPLLRGVKHLHISSTFERPSLLVWLDALDKMPISRH